MMRMERHEMHHPNWDRRTWTKHPDGWLRKVRTHPGLILPTVHYNHRLLHHMMTPTPIPSTEVAINLLEELGDFQPGMDRFATFQRAASFLIHEGRTDPRPHYAESAYDLGHHYIVQLGFLAMNEELAAAALRAA